MSTASFANFTLLTDGDNLKAEHLHVLRLKLLSYHNLGERDHLLEMTIIMLPVCSFPSLADDFPSLSLLDEKEEENRKIAAQECYGSLSRQAYRCKDLCKR
jgi:hypothetical protein